MSQREYHFALDDYQRARRQAAVQEMLARVTGSEHKNQLLSYDEVRRKLHAIERSAQHLKEIPLDAIVGSVDRYTDFTRKFLPRKSISPSRWARVMAFARGLTGLPPIEVYQIGEVYFVRDGNHRVSVARRLGAKAIQAYVTYVETKVEVTPDLDPDQLIIKAEEVNFLERTRLDRTRPEADLTATTAGAYPTILEHIDVHRYFMGLEEEREIPYPEAAAHWYDEVYLPVVEIIRRRNLLRDFPDRTEADLYLWVAKHRQALQDEIGWDIGSEAALADLADRHRPSFWRRLLTTVERTLTGLLPDVLQVGPPPGTWRIRRGKGPDAPQLFSDILVALDESPQAWAALAQAARAAAVENSGLHGIHIHPPGDLSDRPGGGDDRDQQRVLEETHQEVKERFARVCREAGLERFDFQVVKGDVDRTLCSKARFTDLVVLPLNYPPGENRLERLDSGLRILIRSCPQPLLAVPGEPSPLDRAVLAYDGSPKSREALYIAAYLAGRLSTRLTVLTSSDGLEQADRVQREAQDYLQNHRVRARYLTTEKPVAEAVLHQVSEGGHNLILVGGYGSGPLVEVMLGSVVDEILRGSRQPVLICR
jgi:nucleotide-binding universal stress UspA family protein